MGRLAAAADGRWDELSDAAFLQPALSDLPDAQVVLDEVFGDVRLRSELAANRVEGPFGPFDSCTTSSYLRLRSGLGLPGGGMVAADGSVIGWLGTGDSPMGVSLAAGGGLLQSPG